MNRADPSAYIYYAYRFAHFTESVSSSLRELTSSIHELAMDCKKKFWTEQSPMIKMGNAAALATALSSFVSPYYPYFFAGITAACNLVGRADPFKICWWTSPPQFHVEVVHRRLPLQ